MAILSFYGHNENHSLALAIHGEFVKGAAYIVAPGFPLSPKAEFRFLIWYLLTNIIFAICTVKLAKPFNMPYFTYTLSFISVCGLITGLYDHFHCYLSSRGVDFKSSSEYGMLIPIIGVTTTLIPYLFAMIILWNCE